MQLFFGVARPHRNCHRAKFFRAQLEPDTGCPQPVTGGNLDTVKFADARNFIAPREHGCPVVDILCGIGDDDRFAGRAGRRVDADDLAVGNRLNSQGISVAEVVFGGEGELLEIFLRMDTVDTQITIHLSIITVGTDQPLDLVVDQLDLFTVQLQKNHLLFVKSYPVR